MRGWGANLGAELRARKGELLDQIKTLDVLADSAGLSADEWLQRYSLEASLMEIYKGEELFWQCRGGQKWLLEGDANTAYFQAIANGRRHKCSSLVFGMGRRSSSTRRRLVLTSTPSIKSSSRRLPAAGLPWRPTFGHQKLESRVTRMEA